MEKNNPQNKTPVTQPSEAEVRVDLENRREMLREEIHYRREAVENFGRKWVFWAGVLLLVALAGLVYPFIMNLSYGEVNYEDTFYFAAMAGLLFFSLATLLFWNSRVLVRLVLSFAAVGFLAGLGATMVFYVEYGFIWSRSPEKELEAIIYGLAVGFGAAFLGTTIILFILTGLFASAAGRLYFPLSKIAGKIGFASAFFWAFLVIIYVISVLGNLRSIMQSLDFFVLTALLIPFFLVWGLIETYLGINSEDPEINRKSSEGVIRSFMAIPALGLVLGLLFLVYDRMSFLYGRVMDPFLQKYLGFGKKGEFALMIIVAAAIAGMVTYALTRGEKKLKLGSKFDVVMAGLLIFTGILFMEWIIWMAPLVFEPVEYKGEEFTLATQMLTPERFYEYSFYALSLACLAIGILIHAFVCGSLAMLLACLGEWSKNARKELTRLEIETNPER